MTALRNLTCVVATVVLIGCTASQKSHQSSPVAGVKTTYMGEPAAKIPQRKPLLVENSGDQLVAEGGTARFSIGAKKTENPSYAWFFNCELITNATTSELTIHGVTTNKVGAYTCQVTDGVKMTVSQPMQLMSYTTNSTGAIYITYRPTAANVIAAGCPGSYSGYVRFPTAAKAIQTGVSVRAMWSNCSAIVWDDFVRSGCCPGAFCAFSAVVGRWHGFVAYFPPAAPPTSTSSYTLELVGFSL
jgi:hypothetical protein